MNKPTSDNDPNIDEPPGAITQFTVQGQPGQFMMRQGGQNFRFQQNFIHQQPPPMSQASQFGGTRGQIMSNSSMNMYGQNVGQSQMMQPPPATTTTTHQFIQQDMNAYQSHNSNFHANQQQQLNMSRFSAPQQHQQPQPQMPMSGDNGAGMMTGNYQQQQPRFRQW